MFTLSKWRTVNHTRVWNDKATITIDWLTDCLIYKSAAITYSHCNALVICPTHRFRQLWICRLVSSGYSLDAIFLQSNLIDLFKSHWSFCGITQIFAEFAQKTHTNVFCWIILGLEFSETFVFTNNETYKKNRQSIDIFSIGDKKWQEAHRFKSIFCLNTDTQTETSQRIGILFNRSSDWYIFIGHIWVLSDDVSKRISTQ